MFSSHEGVLCRSCAVRTQGRNAQCIQCDSTRLCGTAEGANSVQTWVGSSSEETVIPVTFARLGAREKCERFSRANCFSRRVVSELKFCLAGLFICGNIALLVVCEEL